MFLTGGVDIGNGGAGCLSLLSFGLLLLSVKSFGGGGGGGAAL